MADTGLAITREQNAPFGAEIRGVDPNAISEEQKSLIRDAYGQAAALLCFPFDRLLAAEELHALTRVFGENEYAPGLIHGIGRRGSEEEEELSALILKSPEKRRELQSRLKEIHDHREAVCGVWPNLNVGYAAPKKDEKKGASPARRRGEGASPQA